MKGFKVVNYNEWVSIPDIFGTVYDAKVARDSWKYKKGSVIESFNSKNKYAKIIKGV